MFLDGFGNLRLVANPVLILGGGLRAPLRLGFVGITYCARRLGVRLGDFASRSDCVVFKKDTLEQNEGIALLNVSASSRILPYRQHIATCLRGIGFQSRGFGSRIDLAFDWAKKTKNSACRRTARGIPSRWVNIASNAASGSLGGNDRGSDII